MAVKLSVRISNFCRFPNGIFKSSLVSVCLLFFSIPLSLFSQQNVDAALRKVYPAHSIPNPLLEPIPDPKPFSFKSNISDNTDYPPITNSLTVFTGYDRLRAIFGDGSNEMIKIVGEFVVYREVQGNVAVILTDKRLYAIDSIHRKWVSHYLYGDEKIQFKLGNNGITVKSDRRIYVYLSGWENWQKNALEGEIVSGMSSLGNLATVITNKRVIVYSVLNPEPIEEDILTYKIGSYQILSDSIVYTSGSKYYHYTDLLQKITLQEYRD